MKVYSSNILFRFGMPFQFENLTKIVLKCLNVSATRLVFGHHLKNKSFNELTIINISNTRFVRYSDCDCGLFNKSFHSYWNVQPQHVLLLRCYELVLIGCTRLHFLPYKCHPLATFHTVLVS